MSTFQKKSVVVTGGSRGIGAATATLLAKKGYNICLTYISNQLMSEQIVKDIQQKNDVMAIAVQVDLTNEKEVVNLFKFAHNKFGSVDVLINNAGISGNRFKLADMEMKEFKRVIDINLIGSFICAREAVRCMGYSYGGNGGSIVNISSTAAQTGGYHLSHYAASKSAILSMTLSLSHECAIEGIRVNSVSPGVIATDQNNCVSQSKIQQTIPLQRIGQPIDVANTIAWLVSDQASYITGIDIPVAGGK